MILIALFAALKRRVPLAHPQPPQPAVESLAAPAAATAPRVGTRNRLAWQQVALFLADRKVNP